MLTLYMLIGAPACGKSTVAKDLQEHLPNAVIIYPDELRDAMPQRSNTEIFVEAHRRTWITLTAQQDVIFDATNTKPPHRRQLIVIGRRHQAAIVAIVMDTPLSVCLERHTFRQLNRGQLGLTDAVIERYCHELTQYC